MKGLSGRKVQPVIHLVHIRCVNGRSKQAAHSVGAMALRADPIGCGSVQSDFAVGSAVEADHTRICVCMQTCIPADRGVVKVTVAVICTKKSHLEVKP